MSYKKNNQKLVNDNLSFVINDYMSRGIISLDEVRACCGNGELMTRLVQKEHKYAISLGKDGRWSTYVEDSSKPYGRRRVAKKSKEDLEKYLVGFYSHTAKLSMRFGEMYQEWCGYKKKFMNAANPRQSIAPNTIKKYENAYKDYFSKCPLSKHRLSELTVPLIQEELADMIKENGIKEKYASNLIGYVCMALLYAYQREYISKDLSSMLDRKLLYSICNYQPPKENRVLMRAELQGLMQATLAQEREHPRYMPNYAVELAVYTGLRVGELAALSWEDVSDGMLHVRKSEHRYDYSDKKSELVIGLPKNCKTRSIPLTGPVLDLLEKIRRLGMPDTGFIFLRENGERCSAHDISCACRRRGMEAGIDRTVSIHMIRRTVSSLLNTMLPRTAVCSILGHNEEVNEQHYDYDISENAEKIRALTRVYSNVLNFSDYDKTKKEVRNA